MPRGKKATTVAARRPQNNKPRGKKANTVAARRPQNNKPRGKKANTVAARRPQNNKQNDEVKPNLDLAFAMDCTGSMGAYILTARQNIRKIVDDINATGEKDVRLALVEYRDHPPQDNTFVTKKHNFTKSLPQMRAWLNKCSAFGGGDPPEAVADALYDVSNLQWRPNATKVCVLVSDAPPHGLGIFAFDGFPDGCPKGFDPMELTRDLAQKGITLYCVGCEPSINPYKQFFKSLAYITGGQYIPLRNAKELTRVIVGGAQEEMSLEPLMDEVMNQLAVAGEDADEEEVVTALENTWRKRNVNVTQLQQGGMSLNNDSETAKSLSICANMAAVRTKMCKTTETALKRKRSATDDVVASRAKAARPSTSSCAGASFNIVSTGITQEQTARMVQKARMRMNKE